MQSKVYESSNLIESNPFSQHHYKEWENYLDNLKIYCPKEGEPGIIGTGDESCFFYNVGIDTPLSKKKGWTKAIIQLSNEDEEGLETVEGLMPKKKFELMSKEEKEVVIESYNRYLKNPKVQKQYDETKIPDKMRPVEMDSKSFYVRINIEKDKGILLFMDKLNDKLIDLVYQNKNFWPECLKNQHKKGINDIIKINLNSKKINTGKDMIGLSVSMAEKQNETILKKYGHYFTKEELEGFSRDAFDSLQKNGIVSEWTEIKRENTDSSDQDKNDERSLKDHYDRNFTAKILRHTLDYQEYIIRKEKLMQAFEEEQISKNEYENQMNDCKSIFDTRYSGLKTDTVIEETSEDGEVYYERGRIQDIEPGSQLKASIEINYIYITKGAKIGTSLRLKAVCVKKPKKYVPNDDNNQREPDEEIALNFVNLNKKKRPRENSESMEEKSSKKTKHEPKVESLPEIQKSTSNDSPNDLSNDSSKDDELLNELCDF